MPFKLTAVSIIAAAAAVTNSSNDEWPTGLSIQQFDSILSTEISEKIKSGFSVQSVTIEDIDTLWDSATASEWEHAKNAESTQGVNLSNTTFKEKQPQYLRSSNATVQQTTSHNVDPDTDSKSVLYFPYVVCVRENRSGYKIKYDIESHFGSNLSPIYNKDDMTCYVTYAPFHIASSAPDHVLVQPLFAEMKIGAGTIQAIEKGLPSKFEAILCPGVARSKDIAEGMGRLIIDSMKKGQSGGRSLVSERVLQTEPLSRAHDTGSKKHIDAMNILDSEYSSFVPRERLLLWQSVLGEGIDLDRQCDAMFENIQVSSPRIGNSFTLNFSGDDDASKSSTHSSDCLLSLVAGLASRSEVCFVGVIHEVVPLNAQAQWIIQSGVKNDRPWFDAGLTGRGQVIAISDTGIDTDNCYFWDASGEVVKNGSVDQSRRKVIQYTDYADRYDTRGGHGTHVVGTAIGRRSTNGREESAGAADGVARDAKAAFFDIGTWWGGGLSIPVTVDELLDPGKRAGANIHSGSWGAPFNEYGFQDRAFDEYVYKDEDFLIIIAAGNSGSSKGINSMNTVGSPAVAKNIITVGASQSALQDISANEMLGPDYLADFSSRGPTADGRTKPEIVAPGYFILSANAQPSSTGECDDTGGTQYLAGTSMATPVVSGTAALVRQYFEEGWYPSGKSVPSDATKPSGTLVKAVLLNGAQSLKGIQNGNIITNVAPYDNNQNFGRISMIDSLRLDGKNNLNMFVIDRKRINDGKIDSIDITIDSSGGCKASELSATLVWADPPATPGCRQCVLNDLDLYVTRYGDTRRIFPNGLNQRDSKNNAERVRVEADDGDRFIVSVKAHDLETPNQSYALVVTGCFVNDPQATSPPPSSPSPPTYSPTSPPSPPPDNCWNFIFFIWC